MSILTNTNPRRDFPIKEWHKEHDLINMSHNKETILLVGRSGTGKTTCCLYRLWYQFSDYWKKAGTIGACHPSRPLMLRKLSCSSKPAITDTQSMTTPPVTFDAANEGTPDGDKLEHLHQVFVTKNYVLCSQIKKRFYDMAASNVNFAKHMEYENQALPTNLDSVHSLAFPLFLTSRQFLLMLDASLDSGKPFFPRNKDGVLTIKISSSDYNQDNPDALFEMEGSDDEDFVFDEGDDNGLNPMLQSGSKSMPTWYEVTSLYFINQIWPKISSGVSCSNIDPLLVWMEIKSFIKGSAQAIETAQGYLSESEYLVLGKKMATNFVGNREEIYKIFLRYENYLQKKRSLNLFDDCQLVHSVYQRLIRLEKDPLWSIHNFYIDEVQDFTQAELSVFIRCCRDPNDLFLTGDTAQSIMRGIAFRFSDLRSLFHYANEKSSQSHRSHLKIEVPIIQNLIINFRSHSGILKLASSVIDLMKKFFPNSFDTLPDDSGLFHGPVPTFLQSCQISDLALLLKSNKRTSSSIEFGAHQVIIVQNDAAKKDLPDVLKTGVVLTVFESKGLEFDDVLLYNFFSDATVDKEWRVVTTYAEQFKYPDSTIPLENKPRPLEFNEKEHKSLNAEFKYLYTAITRAKCNLWIYDSDETKRLPILDYWIRKDLVKVVRMGEKEDEDKILFTATSTPEQWKEQGDYFKRKGLWEPAMKCYHKADCIQLEKEAEAYMFAQMAKSAKNVRETFGLFEKAACAFLYCDHLNHSVKFLTNAAKCLRNSKRHSEAAKLFEKLGELELAKKSFMKAKDHNNIARLREMGGDYSGAVRVFARYNQKLQALERAQLYEKRGITLEMDVSLFQLANEYAKYYQSRRDEGNLSKVLAFIEDPLVRVAHLKNARFYHLALDEYLMCKKEKEAVDLILAQEMYEHGFSLAAEEGEREVKKGVKLGPLFKLSYATSEIYHSRNSGTKGSSVKGTRRHSFDSISEFLLDLTKDNNELVTRAKAKLLSGIIQEKPALCLEAMTLYINGPLHDTVGSLEAFNQAVNLGKTDCSLRLIVSQCFQSKEVSSLCVGKSAKSTQIMKLAARFYHFNRLEDVYLLPKSQDIWFGNLFSLASVKEKPTDENGMIRLDQEKLRKALSARYANFVKEWVEKTAIVRRLNERLQLYRFHKNLSEDRPLNVNHDGFLTGTTCEYIEMVDLSMKLAKFMPGSFDTRTLGKLVPNIFSPMFSLCMPVSKANCTMIQKCSIVRESLESDLQYFLDDRSLLKPNLDDLFDAWQCSCLMNTAVDMEKRLEEFASKRGPGTPGSVADQENTKPWLFINRKGKLSYHHFFSYILKAYRLIREAYQVIGSIKIIFHCFLAVVSKRPTLQKKLSIHNLINVVNICITGLVALLVVDDPELDLMLPYYYRNQCQLFDDLNIQDNKQFWLLTACVRQIYNLPDNRLARLAAESCELLSKLLSFLLGDYSEQYNVLDMAVNGSEEMMLMHVMVSVLMLLANVRLLGDENARYISECMKKIIVTVKVGTKLDGPLSSILMDIHSQLAQATSVYDVLSFVQVLLSKYKYQPVMARLHVAKSGTMEFKEVTLSSELRDVQVIANNKKSVSTKAMPSKPSTTKMDELSETTPTNSTDSGNKGETTLMKINTQATPTGATSMTSGTTNATTGTTNAPIGTTSGTTGGVTGTTGGVTGGVTGTTGGITSITSGVTGTERRAQTIPQPVQPLPMAATSPDTVLQTLQQQLMFILQQKQQLEQYRVLLSQQLLSLQQTPLEDLVLYQQQLLQLRQQEYQANEASKQLELQHQQINYKMLQHYNSQKMFKPPQSTFQAATTPTNSLPNTLATTPTNSLPNTLATTPTNSFPNTQAPPINGLPITQASPANSFQTTLPSAPSTAVPRVLPTNISLPQTQLTQTPPTIVVQPTSSNLSMDTMISRESSMEAMKHSPMSEVFFDSKSPSPIGTRGVTDSNNSSKTNLDTIVSSFSRRQKPKGGTVEEGIMDEEMMDLLKQSSESDFFTEIKPVDTPSVIRGDDNELVDQYYCQVCGVSFKSEGSETNLEETNASLASVLFHNTNFETYDDHIKSESHQENYFAHSQFMLFKEQSYSEPRKQLDNLLDNTGCTNSANVEQFIFSIRSQLRNFDEEVEEYKDSYKWRNAHSLMVAFVEKMMSLTRQLVKMRTTESVQIPVPSISQSNLADLVFVDDEDDDDFELEGMLDEPTYRHGLGGHGGDARRKKKTIQRK